jgi:hypothetical protein
LPPSPEVSARRLTNASGGGESFESLVHKVQSIVGGPTAKSFNLISRIVEVSE